MIWSISWKNVWRNRVRSGVVIAAFTFGIFGGIFMVAVMMGMIDTRVKNAIGNEVSHIQVHHPKFLENNELKYTIDHTDSLVKEIQAIPGVEGVSPRIKILGMASTSGNASGVMINGIDPSRERMVSGIPASIVPGGGDFFESDGRNPAVIGEKLAKTLKLNYYLITDESLEILSEQNRTGSVLPLLDSLKGQRFRDEQDFDEALVQKLGKNDAERYEHRIKDASIRYRLNRKIVLSFQAMDGHIAYDAFRVTGVYRTGNAAFDGMNLYVLREDIASTANMRSDQTNQMAILLNSVELDDQVKPQVSAIVRDMNVQKWDELMPEAKMYTAAMDFYLMIFMVIILLALGFGIVNTMLMAILERIKELGMLMAIGMNKRRVFIMIMLETIFLALVGSLAGMAISYALIWYTGNRGIDLTALYQEGFEAMGFSAKIFPSIGPESFFQVISMVILTGVIASIYPARKALKLNPSEALRMDM